MQIKLKVAKITYNEDGTVTTKLTTELAGAVEGATPSGALFITVPSQADQPESLTYGAELNSDLAPFVDLTPPEPPEAPGE
ncbi:hypothetical protein [Candidatus Formimonas warabiya]|uniref:Uncharacterized protein n=1 Tax=Formimonas warabiya TaxID=1761012 RepID=A0A3G1KNY0_FORW1|nr:hypothetical protein [Candidatus Formimonas warabiya]ATW24183.1 hypothetical protein DCMF_04735 [Candidatus Formimonas warabiya]